MKQIKVYHNPHFLDYQGSHGQIIPPTQPVASVRAAAEMPLVERLGLAFRQTQHTYMLFGINLIYLHSWVNYIGGRETNGYQLGKISTCRPA